MGEEKTKRQKVIEFGTDIDFEELCDDLGYGPSAFPSTWEEMIEFGKKVAEVSTLRAVDEFERQQSLVIE